VDTTVTYGSINNIDIILLIRHDRLQAI